MIKIIKRNMIVQNDMKIEWRKKKKELGESENENMERTFSFKNR